MDTGLLSRGLEVSKATRRTRRWLVLLAAAVCVSGFGAYKVYHMPCVVNKRRRLSKLVKSLITVIEMLADSAETMRVVSRDLKDFMQSDSDYLPNSLKQISKIATSQYFSTAVCRASESLTVGILRGLQSSQLKESGVNLTSSSFSDRVMDKMMSKAGTGFVSSVVGTFARNLVLGLYSDEGLVSMANEAQGNTSVSTSSSLPGWVTLLHSDQFREVMADCIQTFVSTTVAVYLDKTMEMNVYDDFFKAMTNPNHQQDIKETLVFVCNGAVETLVKTSHKLLTTSSSDENPSSTSYFVHSGQLGDELFAHRSSSNKFSNHNSFDETMSGSGWIDRMTSTLAVPSNRKLVLDVTGRVTFETVRSIVDFALWKLSDGMKRSLDVAHVEVVGKGREALRYFSAKSSIIFTVCLALYLHVLGTTKDLVHA